MQHLLSSLLDSSLSSFYCILCSTDDIDTTTTQTDDYIQLIHFLKFLSVSTCLVSVLVL